MDINQMIAWGANLLLGIGAVAVVVKKFLPKAKKGISIATESLNTINDILLAAEPGQDGKIDITPEEITEIAKHIKLLKEALKK